MPDGIACKGEMVLKQEMDDEPRRSAPAKDAKAALGLLTVAGMIPAAHKPKRPLRLRLYIAPVIFTILPHSTLRLSLQLKWTGNIPCNQEHCSADAPLPKRESGTFGGGSMAYNKEEWMAKMDKAQTTEEITALIMELPDRGPLMTPDDPDYFFMEPMLKYKPSTSTPRTAKPKSG